jgi:hypothetical protein
MFDILFPGHQPRPRTPYIDHELIQPITLYQEFVARQGPQILSQVLTVSGAVSWNLPNEERDLAAFQHRILQDGLNLIFDQWASQSGIALTESLATSSTVESSAASMDQRTPSSGISFPDMPGSSAGSAGHSSLQDWQCVPEITPPGDRGEFANMVWADESGHLEIALTEAEQDEIAQMLLNQPDLAPFPDERDVN